VRDGLARVRLGEEAKEELKPQCGEQKDIGHDQQQ
jgi:hypothetical protein